ncbi:DUF2796 domain-containing protein [Ruegeria sp. Ofav3-42]|uniref:ZrgA family zinc uptake protein n=1 Tax=Ruegeria sp. Ofav3-42 TaxID=2917759 RepID=UPI001EF7249C|nr:DUF2796 domain-containing protein [Ruegeria sp. Ofav3-42]MCG7520907.1 DUF2796 domain-containing protein [Ruegeria sp. Ofav3-42]
MKCAVFALILTPAIALSQTQSPAHVHGTGYMDIAFSGETFSLSLAVPAADIIGFEGPAETDDDRALVAVAISDLSKPLGLFVLPEEAGCFTASANVTLSGEGLGQDANGQTADQAKHSEFLADYQIQCQDMAALVNIRFAYFDRFENAQKLIVRIARSGENRSYDVTRSQTDLAM